MQSLSETESGSDENLNLSEGEFILANESEHSSADETSFIPNIAKKMYFFSIWNEENFLINLDSNHASN